MKTKEIIQSEIQILNRIQKKYELDEKDNNDLNKYRQALLWVIDQMDQSPSELLIFPVARHISQ